MASELREKMIQEMEIRGLDEKTKKAYLGSMERLTRFFKTTADKIELAEIKKFQQYMVKKKYAANSINRHVSGIRFFYLHVLERHWYVSRIPRMKSPSKVPTILSEEEVAKMIDSVHSVFYKAILMVSYSAGLRQSEVRNLRTGEIDSKRMVINIRNGKGKKDREALLSPLTLKCLRTYWRLFRLKNQVKSDWLFIPTKNSHGNHLDKKLSHTAIGYIFDVAVREAGIKKKLLPIR